MTATLPRILLVMTEFPPRIGGMQTHAVYLARYLASKGYEISVLTYQPTRNSEKERWREVDASLPFPVHRILSRLSFWATVEKIESFARTWRPDLVYCSTVFYGFVRDALNLPVLCRSVGNDVMRPWIAWPFKPMSQLFSLGWLERPLYDLYERLECPEWIERIAREQRHKLMEASACRMSRIIANSEFTAGLLEHAGVRPENIEVLVGGVDVSRFQRPTAGKHALRQKLGLPEGAWLMTTACRLVPKKGIDFLLRAFTVLREEVPDAHLMIIGSGPRGRRWRRLTRTLGLDDVVTFAGSVDHDDIPSYYWASDAFVLASRIHVNRVSGLRDAETMGRVLCEANAAGVPVLASRSGGIPSVIQHQTNGLLFEPEDVDDFVAKAATLRRDEHSSRAMAKRGQAMAAEQFDWSVIVGAHEALFKQVLRA